MKICLVPCPIIREHEPRVTDEKQSYLYLPYLPVGLLTLSTLLEQADHEVTIVDPVWESASASPQKLAPGDPARVAQLIQAKAPDLVGFGTICSSYPATIRWAEAFRQLSPGTPILLGGPQATATDEQSLRAFPWIDMVLRGEAENSIIPLVTCVQAGSSLRAVPGLTWRSNSQVVRNPDAPIVHDLDTLPAPAYHLYPVERLFQRYSAGIGPFHQPFPLEAGRGCPFNCSFCSTSGYFRRRYRAKSVDRLIHEMTTLHATYGLDHFDLSHDLFTCDRSYVLEYCRRLREKDLHKLLKWECYSRIDTIDGGMLAEMAAAGCVRIFYGIETGSQRMQALVGKNLPLAAVKPIVKETLSLGIGVTTSFICGFPQERIEDLSQTFALVMDMIRMGVDQAALLPLIPLVGSRLFREFGHTIRYEENRWESNCPEVFASLYHYDTPFLDRDLLGALARVVNRYPRLLAALSAKDVDFMSIFQKWTEWCHANLSSVPESYHPESRFMLDFLRFLRESLNGSATAAPHVNDIIRYHVALESVTYAEEDAPIVSDKFDCDVPALMHCLIENKAPTPDALKATVFLFWKNDGKVVAQRLTPTLAELLEIPSE
ncbi:MAG: cobalamin B12-binding domain-containing protein [Chloroflexi bacterium]|nr:cobalamin B12-binding domain-containing protein [Chloroflexota bacterium]